MASKEKTSPRLRATLKIAKLAGFKYDNSITGYKFGGFFSTYQLEKIAEKLEKAKVVK